MFQQSFSTRQRLFPLLLGSFLLAVIWASQPLAGDSQSDDRDGRIRDIILSQIEAFANNDREGAWAHASEGVKRRFGTAEQFMIMVREAYPQVHGARAIEFTQRVPHGAFEIQVVRLQGPEGRRWDAYYRMERAEGEWKIAGVRLDEADMGI